MELCQVQHQLHSQNQLRGFPPEITRLITGHKGLSLGSSYRQCYFPEVFNRPYFEYLRLTILITISVLSRKPCPLGHKDSFLFLKWSILPGTNSLKPAKTIISKHSFLPRYVLTFIFQCICPLYNDYLIIFYYYQISLYLFPSRWACGQMISTSLPTTILFSK